MSDRTLKLVLALMLAFHLIDGFRIWVLTERVAQLESAQEKAR